MAGEMIKRIDGAALRAMIAAGAETLGENRERIDALNVFPVPDGDTGTNMSMTFLTASKEALAAGSDDIGSVALAASNGSLRGARGNSGVILSQLLRGFAKGLENLSGAGTEELALALRKSVEMAYKAVMKPKEGTILTVAKIIADRAEEVALDTDDIFIFLREIIDAGNDILSKTTDMLPALRQANVVDAGGQGLLCIFEGAYAALMGNAVPAYVVNAKLPDMDKIDYKVLAGAGDDIKFIYCTEFIITRGDASSAEQDEDEFKRFLDENGDSIVVVADGALIKTHVHTNNPGVVIEKALTYGSIDSVKIENMLVQHTEKINFGEQTAGHSPGRKKTGFVAVSMGDGLKELFESLGADAVIEGGQTMNPSSEDILNAINGVNADEIYVLPNNKNVILAAEQAADMAVGKNVVVMRTKSLPQGIAAIIGYSDLAGSEENVREMNGRMEAVHSGYVTFAVRDSAVNGLQISEGDVLCLYDGEIAITAKDASDGAKRLIDYMMEKTGGEIMTVYYGDGVAEEDAEDVRSYAEEKYAGTGCEFETQYGGQPLYYYIISLE